MELLTDPQVWLAFLTLTALEIVLGIDNLVFIAILVGRLPVEQQAKARTLGLVLALVMRILLLLSIYWVMGLTQPLFEVLGQAVAGRDIILIVGGLFLLAKSTMEIHTALEGDGDEDGSVGKAVFGAVIFQIAMIDVVFSLDSVITAVGLAKDVEVMIAAIVVAMAVMIAAAGAVSRFVEEHPTIKMLALAFLILIGTALIGEGLHFHIPKGYIYFAMAFSIAVEMLNLKVRKRRRGPVHLRKALKEAEVSLDASETVAVRGHQ